jgi:protein gp37
MTAIEWTDETWNPTTGCDRVSPGCDSCYALTMAKRLKAMGSPKYQNDGDERTSGPGFGLACHSEELDRPLRWKKPRRIFVDSMSDLFHPDVPAEFITEVWDRMTLASQHTFQVLTKRPQRMAELLPKMVDGIAEQSDGTLDLHPATVGPAIGEWPAANVWLGTSIETNRYVFRADHLRATPAAIRFLSLEPLLGPLPSLDLTGIDWVIVGGESGPGARPMHPDWVRDIRDRCTGRGVPFFVKQLSSGGPKAIKDIDRFPEDLRIREMPNAERQAQRTGTMTADKDS